MLNMAVIKRRLLLVLVIWIIFNLYAGNYLYTATRPVEYYGNTLQYHHRQLVNESFRFVAKIKETSRGSQYIYVRKNLFGLRQFMELSTAEEEPLTVYHVKKLGETLFGDYHIRTGQLSDDGEGTMKFYLEKINEFKVEPLESEKFLYSE